MSELEEKKYPSWDIQYFKNWILVKTILSWWVVINYNEDWKIVSVES